MQRRSSTAALGVLLLPALLLHAAEASRLRAQAPAPDRRKLLPGDPAAPFTVTTIDGTYSYPGGAKATKPVVLFLFYPSDPLQRVMFNSGWSLAGFLLEAPPSTDYLFMVNTEDQKLATNAAFYMYTALQSAADELVKIYPAQRNDIRRLWAQCHFVTSPATKANAQINRLQAQWVKDIQIISATPPGKKPGGNDDVVVARLDPLGLPGPGEPGPFPLVRAAANPCHKLPPAEAKRLRGKWVLARNSSRTGERRCSYLDMILNLQVAGAEGVLLVGNKGGDVELIMPSDEQLPDALSTSEPTLRTASDPWVAGMRLGLLHRLDWAGLTAGLQGESDAGDAGRVQAARRLTAHYAEAGSGRSQFFRFWSDGQERQERWAGPEDWQAQQASASRLHHNLEFARMWARGVSSLDGGDTCDALAPLHARGSGSSSSSSSSNDTSFSGGMEGPMWVAPGVDAPGRPHARLAYALKHLQGRRAAAGQAMAQRGQQAAMLLQGFAAQLKQRAGQEARSGGGALGSSGDGGSGDSGDGGGDVEIVPSTMVTYEDGMALEEVLNATLAAGEDALNITFAYAYAPGAWAVLDPWLGVSEAGWFIYPTLLHLGWAAQWHTYMGKLRQLLDVPAHEVPVFQYARINPTAHTVVPLPPKAELSRYNRLDLDFTLLCEGPFDHDCPAWDQGLHLYVCCGQPCDPSCQYPLGPGTADGSAPNPMPSPDPACGVEFGRWITPYMRRGGRWLTDVTPLLPTMDGAPSCTFNISLPPWITEPWFGNLTLRFSSLDPPPGDPDPPLRPKVAFPLFQGAWFNSSYNTRAPVRFKTPPGTRAAKLMAVISGHGSDANNCAEFCPTSHHFTLNGKEFMVNFTNPDNYWGCTDFAAIGALPNEAGTWIYGRNGWCPGDKVRPWVVDVSEALAPPGGDNEVAYKGLYGDTTPSPKTNPGLIIMQSTLTVYA